MSLSIESKAGIKTTFSDITFHLIDGDITAHRIILLSNPNTSTSLIPADALYSDSLTLNMTVNTFSTLKLWLYTGTMNYSANKMNLLEWCGQYGENSSAVQFFIQKIITSLPIDNPVQLANIAYQFKLLSFLGWLEWYLANNYDSYKREIKKLPGEVVGRVIKNEWPGEEYNEKLKNWKITKEEWEKSLKSKTSNNNCNIQ